MTDYAGFEVPLPEELTIDLSPAVDGGVNTRWQQVGLGDFSADVVYIFAPQLTRGAYPKVVSAYTGFPVPVFDDDYFNQIILNPSSLALGNLLSSQTRTIEVASTYLVPRTWTSLTNNIGAGSSISGLPTFPHVISSFGNYVFTLSIAVLGPPSIQGTLDFVFDVTNLSLEVTGRRLVIFPYRPQSEVQETLEWATDILEAYDGTEQRLSIREVPRQRIAYDIRTPSGQDDRKLRALLFDWLTRIWGVPIWFEQQPLGVALSAGATEIPCDTTIGDFRVGSLFMIYENAELFESYEIDSMTSSAITIASPLLNSYTAQAVVLPVRQGYAKAQAPQTREPSNDGRLRIEFTTLDNEDLSDTSAAGTYGGKMLLDDPNYTDGSAEETWSRPVVILDNASGRILQSSRVDRARITTRKRWEPFGLAEVWGIRQLLHAMHGSRVSFWLPTFRDDLQLTQTIGGNATSFRVQDAGFTTFVQSRRPLTDIRMTLVNGTVYTRRVTDSEVDGSEELLTIDSAFSASAITVAQVQRIELLMLVRIEGDKAKLKHLRAGEAIVEIDVVSVKE